MLGELRDKISLQEIPHSWKQMLRIDKKVIFSIKKYLPVQYTYNWVFLTI